MSCSSFGISSHSPGFDYSLYTTDSQIRIPSHSSLNLELREPAYSLQSLSHMGPFRVQPLDDKLTITFHRNRQRACHLVWSLATLTITKAWTPSPPSHMQLITRLCQFLSPKCFLNFWILQLTPRVSKCCSSLGLYYPHLVYRCN